MARNSTVNNPKVQFSKHAKEYDRYNIIQQIVSKALIRELKFNPRTILELGCGSGQVFKNIDFEFDYYKAIDFSKSMCDIHPKHKNLEIVCLDFDSDEFKKNLKNQKFDIAISSSALQWSKNLSNIVKTISQVTSNISMVLFTSNTFKTIFELSNTTSPILSLQDIKKSFSSYFDCSFEVINYKIEFDSKKELFDYIKNSGVGATNSTLDYKKAKYLYNYLEFEVVFIKNKI